MKYRISELRAVIRKVLLESIDQNKGGKSDFNDVKHEDADEEDDKLLVEPDLSAEDNREVDEYSSLGGGSIRGYMAPLSQDRKK